MQLFRWHSEALKNYRCGDILAIGVDVHEARQNARKHFEKVSRREWEWLLEQYPDFALDEDQQKERADKIALLEVDIAAEPETSDAFFIAGGE